MIDENKQITDEKEAFYERIAMLHYGKEEELIRDEIEDRWDKKELEHIRLLEMIRRVKISIDKLSRTTTISTFTLIFLTIYSVGAIVLGNKLLITISAIVIGVIILALLFLFNPHRYRFYNLFCTIFQTHNSKVPK